MRTCEACGRETSDQHWCEWCDMPNCDGLSSEEIEALDYGIDFYDGTPREIHHDGWL
jgi:hypothetical protein